MAEQVRASLYGRVSSEEQVEGYSLDAQRRAFRTLVQGRGWTSYREYMEEGRSAHTDDVRKRPVFKEAIDDALAGKYDVMVVHKIDRFSRKLRITLEYFEKLGKAGVGFVSIQNQIDYSTPSGKFMLVMQGGLAELYSDNLSEEVKKGLDQRKAQGLYCGSLPFGVMKGPDGIPMPDPARHSGLITAFELSAQGKSDREVAQVLNANGYRTVGNRGNQPFSNSSVRGIMTNRFYLGYLPDGKGGWINGRHQAFIEKEVWDQAQTARSRNRTSTHSSCPTGSHINSFTGLTYCWYCGGRIHTQSVHQGLPRLGCYTRIKRGGCPQKSAYLWVCEAQILEYLKNFKIPDDYQRQILDGYRALESAYDDSVATRERLERQLKRAKELYEWGDYTRTEYQARRENIVKQLDALTLAPGSSESIERLAGFLADVPAAWEAATLEQRNKLARALFDEIWLKDKEVVFVKPRPEFDPFFRLNYQEFLRQYVEGATSTRDGLHLLKIFSKLLAERNALAVVF